MLFYIVDYIICILEIIFKITQLPDSADLQSVPIPTVLKTTPTNHHDPNFYTE